MGGLRLGVRSSGSEIDALVINGFATGSGISISSSNVTVQGCYLGTDATGSSAMPNEIGISTGFTSSGITIGGTTAAATNVISGNSGSGIEIEGPSSLVEGNLIGTNLAGSAAVPNLADGVLILGMGNVTVGGTSAGASNLISGNGGTGVDLEAPSCLVEGNLIGTNLAGSAAVPNYGDGVAVGAGGLDATGATVGGTSTGTSNLISGNGGAGLGNGGVGVHIVAQSCLVEGNLIGTNLAGSAAVPNLADGVLILGTGDVTVGGTSAGASNLISGNGGAGVNIQAPSCLVEGNLVGTNLAGSAAVANGGDGVLIVGMGNVTVGGTSAGASNLISGNGGTGVNFEALSCLIEGNLIGTNLAGSAAVPNVGDGVAVGVFGGNAKSATVGGTSAGTSNLISGNGGAGVHILSPSCLVEGNLVGTNLAGSAAVPNLSDGVLILGTGDVTVGGTSAGASNLISGNGGAGVRIEAPSCLVEGNLIGTNLAGSVAVANASDGVLIVGTGGATVGGTSAGTSNLISGNGGPGVDIEAPSCLVEGNLIGTNLAGSAAVANGGDGVAVGASAGTPWVPRSAGPRPVPQASSQETAVPASTSCSRPAWSRGT